MSHPREKSEYLFELSLEHADFPFAELRAVAERLGDESERLSERLCIVRSGRNREEILEYARCLSFTLRFSILHGRYRDWDALRKGVAEVAREIKGKRAAVRVPGKGKRMKGHRPAAERELGSIIAERCPIDLENPETEVRVVEYSGGYLLGMLVAVVDRRGIDSRQAKHRTYFSPISLSPRYARALLNLCGVSDDKRVLDPFCGTGGILIEAALLGGSIVGSDIDPEMVAGTEANLRQALPGGKWELRCMDVGRIGELGSFDAVVTDPPYGRSSFRNREELSVLYSRALGKIFDVLVEGGMAGMVVPDASLLPEIPGLERLLHLKSKVHRSLVRNYIVMKKRAIDS